MSVTGAGCIPMYMFVYSTSSTGQVFSSLNDPDCQPWFYPLQSLLGQTVLFKLRLGRTTKFRSNTTKVFNSVTKKRMAHVLSHSASKIWPEDINFSIDFHNIKWFALLSTLINSPGYDMRWLLCFLWHRCHCTNAQNRKQDKSSVSVTPSSNQKRNLLN